MGQQAGVRAGMDVAVKANNENALQGAMPFEWVTG
jgi:hypothetical protein